MTLIKSAGLLLVAAAAVAAGQEPKKEIKVYAENNEEGVSIKAPRSGGKDQMWEAHATESGFWKDSAVLVRHRVDKFSVEVNVTHKDPKEPMSGWAKTSEIGKSSRENFTKKDGDKEPNWKEVRVIAEDPKAKLSIGSGYMHKLKMVDQNGGEREIIEYFILASDSLSRITVQYDKESYQKYFAREGMQILNSIDRAKITKKK